MNVNPFNITFGKEPLNPINRTYEINKIIETFSNENPFSEIYVLTGPRGCGKTVALNSLIKHYRNEKDWMTVDLNPENDLLEQLAGKICDQVKSNKMFLKTEFSFSFHGISFSMKGERPVTNISTLLNSMLKVLQKKNIKLLITIDEVNNNSNMRVFVHEYQSFLREGFSCFLVMTGLYENISALENEKSLTFLYRAPKINLDALSIRSITYKYKELFSINEEKAIELAKITKGYAYAYQLLGYILYENNTTKVNDNILDQFDSYLETRVYFKIWQSLSENEKDILKLVARGKTSNTDIMSSLDMASNALAVYKKRLANKGIVDTNTRATLSFKLPRFSEFIKFNYFD